MQIKLYNLKLNSNIRSFYTPIQPSVKITDDGVSYVEVLPEINLQNFIYCYWNLKTTKPLDNSYNYRVVSDGCVDVFFELSNYQEVYVMGFCSSFVEFDINKEFNYFGIRFLPGAFSILFNIDASELSNRSEYLASVQTDLYKYIQQLISACVSFEGLSNKLNTYFLNHIAHLDITLDKRFSKALACILSNKGMVNIETELNDGISSRHLRRLFNFYVGDTTKSFCRVIRFQNLLKIDPSISLLQAEKLFYDFGYYDQTHFIKEFKQYYGITPSQAIVK